MLTGKEILFGRIAVERGLLTQAQLEDCLRAKEERDRAGPGVGIGALLVERGLLKPEDVQAILQEQGKTILRCPECQIQYNVLGFEAGKRFRCKKCGAQLVVPAELGTLSAAGGILTADTVAGIAAASSAAALPVSNTAPTAVHAVPAARSAPVASPAAAGRPSAAAAGPASAAPPVLSAPQAAAPRATATATRGRTAVDPLIGQVLGGAKILKKLGQGGMGAVYLAHHIALDKRVALKVLPPALTEDPTYVERFKREAKSAARLEHPNVVQIYNIDCENGHHFILMQYVEGENLATYMRRQKRLPVPEAARLLVPVCRALAAAHAKGLVHRDIKPDNIMISKGGEVRVMDFGLARMVGGASKVSAVGTVVGTPYYMAPEQARGRDVDGRSDLYSVGVTFYEMVTGRTPFLGETPMEVMFKHIQEQAPSARAVHAEIPPAADAVISKLLRKEPASRYASAGALMADLEALAAGAAPAVSGVVPVVAGATSATLATSAGPAGPAAATAPPGLPPTAPAAPAAVALATPAAHSRKLLYVMGGAVLAGLLTVLVAVAALKSTLSPARDALKQAASYESGHPNDKADVAQKYQSVVGLYPKSAEATLAAKRVRELLDEELAAVRGDLDPLARKQDMKGVEERADTARRFSQDKDWLDRVDRLEGEAFETARDELQKQVNELVRRRDVKEIDRKLEQARKSSTRREWLDALHKMERKAYEETLSQVKFKLDENIKAHRWAEATDVLEKARALSEQPRWDREIDDLENSLLDQTPLSAWAEPGAPPLEKLREKVGRLILKSDFDALIAGLKALTQKIREPMFANRIEQMLVGIPILREVQAAAADQLGKDRTIVYPNIPVVTDRGKAESKGTVAQVDKAHLRVTFLIDGARREVAVGELDPAFVVAQAKRSMKADGETAKKCGIYFRAHGMEKQAEEEFQAARKQGVPVEEKGPWGGRPLKPFKNK